jgi:inhibitor of KinA sporulation pathway (predicted exonuclease)
MDDKVMPPIRPPYLNVFMSYGKPFAFYRTALYKEIGQRLGRPSYHTGQIRSIEDARTVYRIIREIANAE